MNMPSYITSLISRTANALRFTITIALFQVPLASQAIGVLSDTPETSAPVHVSQSATPLVLLTMARDHSLFFGAYNDLTDLDGTGTINYNFKPTFEYIGLFNSLYCYTYVGIKDSTNQAPGSYFQPAAQANLLTDASYPGGCPSNLWSGNWLNYVTTSRIDAMRVALYGGHRIIDGDANAARPKTLLRRSYIPQDGHTWAKEYTSIAENGYDIRRYTPFSLPIIDDSGAQTRHFFGNLTSTVVRDVSLTKPYTRNNAGMKPSGAIQITGSAPGVAPTWVMEGPDLGISCVSLNDCSSYPPIMRVVLNAGSRVWRWAASQRPVLDYHPYPIGVNPTEFIFPNKGNFEGYGNLYDDLAHYVNPQPDYPDDYTVQVEVCVAPDYIKGCNKYGDSYKPAGVLHDYGENGSMNFGLLTGSYDKNLSGGRLRKNIGTFKDEIVAGTGQFTYKVTPASVPNSLIKQIDNIRIRNYNNPTTNPVRPVPDYSKYFANSFIYKNTYTGSIGDGTEGLFGDWGNPIAEMMYEGLRYFAGAGAGGGGNTFYSASGPTPEYMGTTAADFVEDDMVGLKYPNWTNPYSAANWCAKPNILVVTGPYISSDSDQVPGSTFGDGSFNFRLKNSVGNPLSATSRTDQIGANEGVNGTNRFIGEVYGGVKDFSPTIKYIDSLGTVRGLAPNNPEHEGSYYAAGVAYWGKLSSLQLIAANGKYIPTVDTYAILLPSPDASIKVPFPDGKFVTIEPFAKTVTDPAKGNYQTTNQFVGIYVTEAVTTPGAFSLKFYVNFEDHSAGADFDMDAVAYYEINADASTVRVSVWDNANDAAGGQNMGYVISGTNHDGAYLVVQDRPRDANPAKNFSYYLNVPPPDGLLGVNKYWAGYCDSAVRSLEDRCQVLPNKKDGTSSSITFTASAAATPLIKHPLWYAARWGGYTGAGPAALPDGQDPEHYIQATSPAALKKAFYKMFQSVLDNNGTQGSVTSTSQQLQTSSQIFTTSFNATTFYGELTATTFTVLQGTPSDTVTYEEDTGASSKMPVFPNRNIYFRNASPYSSSLLPFNFDNVTSGSFGYAGSFANAAIVDYLRGDRSKEIQFNGTLRNRQTVMGTTVNSTPLYSPDTNMVYVGANDGMLHAFDASSTVEKMVEKFAYIPTSVIRKPGAPAGTASTLGLITDPGANHRFYVDGDLAITDKFTPSPGMAPGYNYLVGFLGRGGKGLFGLPVNATGVKQDGGVWEVNETGDNHMGHLLGKPVIERLADAEGTNVVIFGNGYNSANNQATLYVVKVSDGTLLARFVTCTGGPIVNAEAGCPTSNSTGQPNGLATPGILRKDGRVQQVYAGDYLGNVWKFDLSTLTGASSSTYYLNDPKIKKIFTAISSTGALQHIVAPIVTGFSYDSVDPDTRDKQYVFFGTGSDLTAVDLATTTTTQTMYGLIDDSATLPSRNTNLRQRSLYGAANQLGTFSGYKGSGTLPVRGFEVPAPGSMTGKFGWYMDLSTPSGVGVAPVEQIFTAAALRPSVTPALVVSSAVANSSACVSTGAGYLNAMDAYSGGGLPNSYFDINRNGKSDETFTDSGGIVRQVGSIDFGIGAIGDAGFTGSNVIVQGSGANTTKTSDNTADVGTLTFTKTSRRTSWREIIN